VDDLYRLAIRFVQRAPERFFADPIAGTLFEGALSWLALDHVDANRSLSKFLGETIDMARSHRVPLFIYMIEKTTDSLKSAGKNCFYFLQF
jgi:hypothetical protein